MSNVEDFMAILNNRSRGSDKTNGLGYPYISGYLHQYLVTLAIQFPEVDKYIGGTVKVMQQMDQLEANTRV